MSNPVGSRASILVVDDEESLAELYAMWLADRYDVTAVSSGEAALEALHPGIDVILLDRNMPNLDGDDVLVTLRNRGYHCRVVLVTGETPDLNAVDLGFDDYLQKPVEVDDFVESIERLLDRDTTDDLRTRLSSLQLRRNMMELEDSDGTLADDQDYRKTCELIEDLERELENRRAAVAEQ